MALRDQLMPYVGMKSRATRVLEVDLPNGTTVKIGVRKPSIKMSAILRELVVKGQLEEAAVEACMSDCVFDPATNAPVWTRLDEEVLRAHETGGVIAALFRHVVDLMNEVGEVGKGLTTATLTTSPSKSDSAS